VAAAGRLASGQRKHTAQAADIHFSL
jgi:hypothetical protein